MTSSRRLQALVIVFGLAFGGFARGESPESKGLRYLSRVASRWDSENHCFSCHDNAEAAKTLFIASASKEFNDLKLDPLASTKVWLSKPEGWNSNGGDEPFSDKRLSRIQFASALAEAMRLGVLKDRKPLTFAASQLVKDQGEDGSWALDGPDSIGSPTTLGRPLATYVARKVLVESDAKRFAREIKGADRWLGQLKPRTTLDAAVILLATPRKSSDPRRKRALDQLRDSQGDTGGWGPYPDAAAEPFDTAVVLSALASLRDDSADKLIRRGRDYLIKMQNEEGSWPETTRPAGAESHAQRVSTAAWATRALLSTR